MKKTISSKTTALSFGVLVICFAAAFYVVAWQEPGQLPPAGNVPVPINVGTDPQAKAGRISATEFYDYNDPSFYVNPSGQSNFFSLCLSGDCVTSWPQVRGEVYTVSCSGSPANNGCHDATVTWTATTTAEEPFTISWSGDDGLSGSGLEVQHVYNVAGTWWAYVTVADKDNVVQSASCAVNLIQKEYYWGLGGCRDRRGVSCSGSWQSCSGATLGKAGYIREEPESCGSACSSKVSGGSQIGACTGNISTAPSSGTHLCNYTCQRNCVY